LQSGANVMLYDTNADWEPSLMFVPLLGTSFPLRQKNPLSDKDLIYHLHRDPQESPFSPDGRQGPRHGTPAEAGPDPVDDPTREGGRLFFKQIYPTKSALRLYRDLTRGNHSIIFFRNQ